MTKTAIVVGIILVASTANAEPCKPKRSFTNADLGKPAAEMCRSTVSDETMADLKARQFHEPPRSAPQALEPHNAGPVAHTPWEFPEPRPARRLDGTLLSDPATVYGPTFYPYYQPRSRRR